MREAWRRIADSEVWLTLVWVVGAGAVFWVADMGITAMIGRLAGGSPAPADVAEIGIVIALGVLTFVFTLVVAKFGSYTAAAILCATIVGIDAFQVVAAVAWASGGGTGVAAMNGWGVAERASQIVATGLALHVVWVVESRMPGTAARVYRQNGS